MMVDTTAMRAVRATHNAAYVFYSIGVNRVFVWDGDTKGLLRVYDPQTWEMVEAWQGAGGVRDRWEARERIREYVEKEAAMG